MIKLIDKKSVGFFLVGFVVGMLLFFFLTNKHKPNKEQLSKMFL